jgi:aspartate aminotransferase
MTSGPERSLNMNIRGMSPSATVAINERSNRLRRDGRRIFKLGLGQSPFPVPNVVVEALREHAPEKDYLPVRGLAELRQAIANYHGRRENIECTGEDVLVGPGSKELMFLLQLVYYGELLIPSPSWVSYEPQAKIIGRKVHWIETRREDGWRLEPERLMAARGDDRSAPGLLILNYPNNPTSLSYTAEQLAEIAEVARRENLVLLADEIYGELHHEGEHTSIARFYPEGTIISAGLSKWCGAGGWRLGTFLFPHNLRWLLDAMAVAAYQDHPELTRYLDRSRAILGALGRWSAAALRSAGCFCPDPEGGFYLMADFGDRREDLAARGIQSGAALCARLLEDSGVAILPGSDFGRPAAELTCRLALVDFDGGAALEALGATGALECDEEFLRAHCPDAVEAIERIISWLG